MGRAFEYRKARKMKRWSAMSKAFTKIGREISLAVKSGGPDPETNSRLRLAIQNAKGANMPKANVEAAIKKASAKDAADLQEITYEGYAPHGVAIIVETATDNPTRTVANVRMYFNRGNGSLGTSGSVSFMFDRKGEFRFKKTEEIDMEELELALIDGGAEDFQVDEEEIFVYCAFEDFGSVQKALEDLNIETESASLERFPQVTKALSEEQAEEVEKLIERIEDDDDVLKVFHTMEN